MKKKYVLKKYEKVQLHVFSILLSQYFYVFAHTFKHSIRLSFFYMGYPNSGSNDEIAMNKTYGKTFYNQLPIASIVFPNPFLTAVTAFVPDCQDFGNCDESYRDLYVAMFVLDLILHVMNWCTTNCGHSKTEKKGYPWPEFCSLKKVSKLPSFGGKGRVDQNSQFNNMNSQFSSQASGINHGGNRDGNVYGNSQFNNQMSQLGNNIEINAPSHNTQYSGFSSHIKTNQTVRPI